MTEVIELSYPVTEDEARDFLRKTSAPEQYEGEGGKAQLDADHARVMEAIAARQQWLQGLDPLTRMQAERQPILSGVKHESERSDPGATGPAADTGGTPGTGTPDNPANPPVPPTPPNQPGSTGL